MHCAEDSRVRNRIVNVKLRNLLLSCCEDGPDEEGVPPGGLSSDQGFHISEALQDNWGWLSRVYLAHVELCSLVVSLDE